MQIILEYALQLLEKIITSYGHSANKYSLQACYTPAIVFSTKDIKMDILRVPASWRGCVGVNHDLDLTSSRHYDSITNHESANEQVTSLVPCFLILLTGPFSQFLFNVLYSCKSVSVFNYCIFSWNCIITAQTYQPQGAVKHKQGKLQSYWLHM